MNIKEYSNMEIDNMSQDDLLRAYIGLQKAGKRIELDMDLIKDKLKLMFEQSGDISFTNTVGEASIVTQNRNNFQQKIAKGFLTEEQLKQCYSKKEIKFIKIQSLEAKSTQVF